METHFGPRNSKVGCPFLFYHKECGHLSVQIHACSAIFALGRQLFRKWYNTFVPYICFIYLFVWCPRGGQEMMRENEHRSMEEKLSAHIWMLTVENMNFSISSLLNLVHFMIKILSFRNDFVCLFLLLIMKIENCEYLI